MSNTHACKMKMIAKDLLDFLTFSKLIYSNKLVFPEFIKLLLNGENGHLFSR